MALNNIVFVKGQGGLGRPLPGEDHNSGLIFYTANGNLPSGFATDDRVKLIASLEDAEDAGILGDFADATAATGQYEVTAIGANGDTIEIAVEEPAGSVDLGTYTKVSGDTTVALVATAIAAMINAGTETHGYSASAALGVVTITAPKRLGIFLNSGAPLSATETGTIAGTVTAFSGGVASLQAVWHYHISEFFRMNPKGLLYVGFFEVPTPYTFAEIQTVQDFANGIIRQLGIYKDSAAYSSADLTTIQGVCDTIEGLHKPLSVLYAADLSAVTDLLTMANLGSLSNPNVSSIIGQDGGALGNFLYLATGKSITTLGAALGAVSAALVSEDIAWVNKFNVSNGVECDVPAFANGTLVSDVSQSTLNLLDDRRHIFLIKYVGVAGSYFNDSHCAVSVSSDYAYIENNRTIDKAIRGVYASLIPELNGPLVLNADGTLKETTVAYFESKAEVPLNQMIRDSELSAMDVVINPAQNVLSTGNLVVAIKLVPIGVAREITVNISFVTSI